VVTGCAAQTQPQLFASMPEVARVAGNEEKLDARLWQGNEKVAVTDIMAVLAMKPHAIDAIEGRARALQRALNCASSVEPRMAVIDELPPVTVWVTASK